MVGWQERHYEEVLVEYSAERAIVDPQVALVRRRLVEIGLLKFLSVRYLHTQERLLT